ncbi:MAG: LytTR family transcriptional regulator DNA-binding domain-containing protein [Flavobacteriales bacterium]|nr:LytTR family transcriptional regulator DNA-binding domain-containing protein [Flavobacteriales bacterium]
MSRRILIVEDEPILADDIEGILIESGYEVVGLASNGRQAMDMVRDLMPNLVMMDISLEGDMDGIMLAEYINSTFGIPFIFLTSHADKLTIDRVKRTRPAGFIVKPFTERSIISNVEIALFKEPESKPDYEELFVRTGNALVKVKFEDILYLQALDNYTQVYTRDKRFTISYTLKTVESKLPPERFIRIHRSYIIHLDAIEKILEDTVIINGHQIPVGRTYHHALHGRLNRI